MRALLIFGLVVGCAQWFPPPRLSPGEQFAARWQGRPEDDVLLVYGAPNEKIVLSTGNIVDSYHRETAQSSSRVAVYDGAGGGRSQSSTVFCDRRFEIDRQSGRVLRAIITGNACDYGL